MNHTVSVDLGSSGYDIRIEPGLLKSAGSLVRAAAGKKAGSAVLITNPTVYALYGKRVEGSLSKAGFKVRTATIGDGERYKTLKTAESLYTFLIKEKIERSDVIVALGGGVVGDLAGFVAATYLRGLALVHIPTTLLAQIDSSIGGKTGVNHKLGKNLIGAFYQPSQVLIDPETATTLPPRELKSGLFEAIKYGVISDNRLFDWISDNSISLQAAKSDELSHLIAECCRIKAQVVGLDEKESGLRRILNFGHTVGHALETLTNYGKLRHGEAVAYGMRAAGRMAELMSLFPGDQQVRLDEAISAFGPLPSAGTLAVGDIMSAMRHDKKVVSGRIIFILPERIGKVIIRDDVPAKVVRSAIKSSLS